MEQSVKEISVKLKENRNKLPFHAKYWRVEKKQKRNNMLICHEYNTTTYRFVEYYKLISYIPNA